jgi:hypothetical protein
VSPGEYTVALKARGIESAATVTVVGDPLLPLADADYRATEDFLLRVEALTERVQEASQREGLEDATAERLRTLAGEIRDLARAWGDAGRFNDGNFGPPSATDVERLGELEADVEGAVGR